MAFSSSAPSISLEEEQAERDSLTYEEKRALGRDLWGSKDADDNPFYETPAMRATCQAALRRALDLIPDTEKKEYLEALDRDSILVEQESDPMAFLRAEDYDTEVRSTFAMYQVTKPFVPLDVWPHLSNFLFRRQRDESSSTGQ